MLGALLLILCFLPRNQADELTWPTPPFPQKTKPLRTTTYLLHIDPVTGCLSYGGVQGFDAFASEVSSFLYGGVRVDDVAASAARAFFFLGLPRSIVR